VCCMLGLSVVSVAGAAAWAGWAVGHGPPKILVGWATMHLAPPIMFLNSTLWSVNILRKISKIGASRFISASYPCLYLRP